MTQTNLKTLRGDREELHVPSGGTMNAIVYTHYGSPDVLQFKGVERPTPKDNEVLIKVHAVSVNAGDLHVLRADPFLIRLMGYGLLKPKNKILGAAIAGRIEAIGGNVKQFQPGDDVFGDLSESGKRGGFAEYVCASADALVLKPSRLSFEEAAAVPVAAVTALGADVACGVLPDIRPSTKKYGKHFAPHLSLLKENLSAYFQTN